MSNKQVVLEIALKKRFDIVCIKVLSFLHCRVIPVVYKTILNYMSIQHTADVIYRLLKIDYHFKMCYSTRALQGKMIASNIRKFIIKFRNLNNLCSHIVYTIHTDCFFALDFWIYRLKYWHIICFHLVRTCVYYNILLFYFKLHLSTKISTFETLIPISLDFLANYFRDIKKGDSESIMNVCSRILKVLFEMK